jgi:hypothetical protein
MYACKEVGLEENIEEMLYTFPSRHQNASQNET